MTEKFNIIFLTGDAWRADFVDSYADIPLLSALDAVASRTVRFENAYANAPWTSPSLLSMLTGESTFRHRVHFSWSSPRSDSPSVVKSLVSQGWNAPSITYLNGLCNYIPLGYAEGGAPVDHDPIRLIKAIETAEEPFFLWFHYHDSHTPWNAEKHRKTMGIDEKVIPKRLRESVCKEFILPRDEFTWNLEDRDLICRLYATGILEMSQWLERVFSALESRGLTERTSMVFTADHGEELLDHGHVGHASTQCYATLYEEVLRIPLIVIDPRAESGTISNRVQGLDIFPTILGLAGATTQRCEGLDLSGTVFGKRESLAQLEAANDRDFLFHSSRMGFRTPPEYQGQGVTAISNGQWKLMIESYDSERTMLFHLKEDPLEQKPFMEGPQVESWRTRLRSATEQKL